MSDTSQNPYGINSAHCIYDLLDLWRVMLPSSMYSTSPQLSVFHQIEDILNQLQKYGRRAGVEDVKKCREGG